MLARAPDFSSASRVTTGRCFMKVPGVLLKNISINACLAVCGGAAGCCATTEPENNVAMITRKKSLRMEISQPDRDMGRRVSPVTEVRGRIG